MSDGLRCSVLVLINIKPILSYIETGKNILQN